MCIHAFGSLRAAVTLALALGTFAPVLGQGQTYTERVLYSFAGGADGANPLAGLVRDATGNLYGTPDDGGTHSHGTVFKVSANGTEIVLHSFTGGADGGNPDAGLIRDTAGNLYGTTADGGAHNYGTVFEVSAGVMERVLDSFTGTGGDGAYPFADLVRDAAANLYGTTVGGGTHNAGTVFKVDPTGKETVLYSFTGGADGRNPYAGFVLDAAGNLYGTTKYGGASGAGTVFKVDIKGKETVLHNFSGGADGEYPSAGLVRDAAGNLYGTTAGGGASGDGTVYKVGTTGKEAVLYSFRGGVDGEYPYAGLIQDAAGNLYGTTSYGGASGAGTIYKVDTTGKETVLYGFGGGANGASPQAGLVQDAVGNLYGTTKYGGASGAGTVFELSLPQLPI